MKPKQDLFDLIKSMSSVEISGFRSEILKRKGKHTYLKVFDFLVELEEFDDESLKKAFDGEKTLNNFSVAKANLYEKILEVMCRLPHNQNQETEFDQLNQQISILVRKGLFEQALIRVTKAIRIAEKLEAFRKLDDLYEMEREIRRAFYSPDEFLTSVREMKQRLAWLAEVEKNLQDFQELYDRATICLRSPEHIAKPLISAIIANPLMQEDSESRSVSAKIMYYRIWKVVYEALRRTEGWQFFSLKIMSLLEDNSHLLTLPNFLIVYLDTVTDFGIRSIKLREFDDAESALKRLRKLKTLLKAGDNELLIQMRYWKIRIHHGMKTLIWEQTQLAIEKLEEGLRKYRNRFSKNEEMEITHLIARAYVTFGYEKKALPWILALREDKISANRPDLHLFSWLFFLIVHYNLKNFDVLEQHVPRTISYMKQHRSYGEFEQAITDFFWESATVLPRDQQKGALRTLQERVETYLDANPRIRIPDYFDIVNWIQSRILDKSLMDVQLGRV